MDDPIGRPAHAVAVKAAGDSVEDLIRRFRRECARSGLRREYRAHRFFRSKGAKERTKRWRAAMRAQEESAR